MMPGARSYLLPHVRPLCVLRLWFATASDAPTDRSGLTALALPVPRVSPTGRSPRSHDHSSLLRCRHYEVLFLPACSVLVTWDVQEVSCTALHLYPAPQDVGFRVWFSTGAMGPPSVLYGRSYTDFRI